MQKRLLKYAIGLLIVASNVVLGPIGFTENSGSPIVLELFTSQGCSSCPPADRFLHELAESPEYKSKIIPLAYNVDIWDHLGWTDPFAKQSWTQRQRRYNLTWRQNTIYTPQLVCAGRYHCVGADEKKVKEYILQAERLPQTTTVDLTVNASETDPPSFHVYVRAEIISKLSEKEFWALAAFYERGLVTEVTAGENEGETLKNDYVVRLLKPVFIIPAELGTRKEGLITFETEAEWKTENMGIAVFLQDPQSMKIHGAAVCDLQSILSNKKQSS